MYQIDNYSDTTSEFFYALVRNIVKFRTVKITGKYGIILYEVDIMVVKEYGKTNKDTIILLHGGGLSWWNYEEVAELLKDEYHIILPILDGHAGSDNDFTNIEDNADEIIKYIDDNYDGNVKLIGGLSLGGQILLDILLLILAVDDISLANAIFICFFFIENS